MSKLVSTALKTLALEKTVDFFYDFTWYLNLTKAAEECNHYTLIKKQLVYNKRSPTIASMYLVFHQQLFHKHLLSFPLLLFLLMYSPVLLHFALMLLRTLKCQSIKSMLSYHIPKHFTFIGGSLESIVLVISKLF